MLLLLLQGAASPTPTPATVSVNEYLLLLRRSQGGAAGTPPPAPDGTISLDEYLLLLGRPHGGGSPAGECPPVAAPTAADFFWDDFCGTLGSDLGLHVSDSLHPWTLDPTTPSGSILLTGSHSAYAPGPARSLYVAGASDPSATPGDYVARLRVTRLSGSGRLGPTVRNGSGSGVWGYYDGGLDRWGLATFAPSGVTVLATRPAGLRDGASTSLTLWTSGRHAVLAADGRIVLARGGLQGGDSSPVGLMGDGTSDGAATGLLGSLAACASPTLEFAGPDAVQAWLEQILPASGACGPRGCFASLEPEPYPFTGGRMAVVRDGQGGVDGSLAAGLGRTYDGQTWEFGLTLVDRLVRDHGTRDSLGNAGLLLYARSVFDILQFTFPRSASGAYLTPEPLRLTATAGAPRAYRQSRQWRAMDLGGSVALGGAMTQLD